MPPGEHDATADEVEARLVVPFSTSLTREAVYRGWRQRRVEIANLIAIESEWVDGSFVTAKRDPSDVDVVTFVDGAAFDSLPENAKALLGQLFDTKLSKLAFRCDGYLVPTRPAAHPGHRRVDGLRDYWRDTWTRHRQGGQKGFLNVRGAP